MVKAWVSLVHTVVGNASCITHLGPSYNLHAQAAHEFVNRNIITSCNKSRQQIFAL
jgi:hypothetical protein